MPPICVAQASARLSGKCGGTGSPPSFFVHSNRDVRAICFVFSHMAAENAALSAVFSISKAHKFLLEMGATNARRRGACFIGS